MTHILSFFMVWKPLSAFCYDTVRHYFSFVPLHCSIPMSSICFLCQIAGISPSSAIRKHTPKAPVDLFSCAAVHLGGRQGLVWPPELFVAIISNTGGT